MTLPSTILDGAPSAGVLVTGLALAIGLFFVIVAVAVIAFKLLKRSLKMAFKVTILVFVIIVAVLAAAGIFVYNKIEDLNKPTPQPTQRRK